jgi:hypothetical protein
MKVRIEFPQVMKMFLTTTIEIPDSANLKEVKERIFKSFWESFNSYFPSRIVAHGTEKDLMLKDREIEILTEEMLRGRLEKGNNYFQAIFITREHPSTKNA